MWWEISTEKNFSKELKIILQKPEVKVAFSNFIKRLENDPDIFNFWQQYLEIRRSSFVRWLPNFDLQCVSHVALGALYHISKWSQQRPYWYAPWRRCIDVVNVNGQIEGKPVAEIEAQFKSYQQLPLWYRWIFAIQQRRLGRLLAYYKAACALSITSIQGGMEPMKPQTPEEGQIIDQFKQELENIIDRFHNHDRKSKKYKKHVKKCNDDMRSRYRSYLEKYPDLSQSLTTCYNNYSQDPEKQHPKEIDQQLQQPKDKFNQQPQLQQQGSPPLSTFQKIKFLLLDSTSKPAVRPINPPPVLQPSVDGRDLALSPNISNSNTSQEYLRQSISQPDFSPVIKQYYDYVTSYVTYYLSIIETILRGYPEETHNSVSQQTSLRKNKSSFLLAVHPDKISSMPDQYKKLSASLWDEARQIKESIESEINRIRQLLGLPDGDDSDIQQMKKIYECSPSHLQELYVKLQSLVDSSLWEERCNRELNTMEDTLDVLTHGVDEIIRKNTEIKQQVQKLVDEFSTNWQSANSGIANLNSNISTCEEQFKSEFNKLKDEIDKFKNDSRPT
jgi:hypothetical protein